VVVRSLVGVSGQLVEFSGLMTGPRRTDPMECDCQGCD
jgi:hypothetical protein